MKRRESTTSRDRLHAQTSGILKTRDLKLQKEEEAQQKGSPEKWSARRRVSEKKKINKRKS